MNLPAIDVKDMLEAESILGLTFATDLFVGFEPDSPDDVVTVFDTTGFSPEQDFDGGVAYFYPSVQVRVRNRSYTEAGRIMNLIKGILHGKQQETWNGTLYTTIYCTGEPALLVWDSSKRAVWVCTFNLQRK